MQILTLVMYMRNKVSICIFIGVFALLIAGVILIRDQEEQETEQDPEVTLVREEQVDEPAADESVPVNDSVETPQYYLVVEDGYLSVYYGPDKTFYGYTDILFDELDAETQRQITEGLSFRDERTLYDFLENHSS